MQDSGLIKPFTPRSNPVWRILTSDPLNREETERLCRVPEIAQLTYLGTSIDNPRKLPSLVTVAPSGGNLCLQASQSRILTGFVSYRLCDAG